MKKFYLIAAALFVINGVLAQWVMQNSGTNKKLNSVAFIDSATGYVVGNDGIILKTDNGGVSWSALNSGTSNSLLSVCFPDPYTGFVVGSNGTILKTTNAGAEWTSQISGTSQPLYSVYFVDNYTGYAVGGGGGTTTGTILKTTDGGITWNSRDSVSMLYLKSVFFTSADTGYIASGLNFFHGSWAMIQKTTNGGGSWTIEYENFTQTDDIALNSIFFSDANTGYAAGCGGTIEKRGIHDTAWKWQNSGTWRELYSVYVVPVVGGINKGYAVGQGGTIQKNENGDSIWVSQVSGTINNLNSVVFTDPNQGYAVGDSGIILKTKNGGVLDVNEIPGSNRQLTIWPNPASAQIILESLPSLKGALVTILNLSGKEILNMKLMQVKTHLDISTLPRGIYFVKLTGENTVLIEKLIKE